MHVFPKIPPSHFVHEDPFSPQFASYKQGFPQTSSHLFCTSGIFLFNWKIINYWYTLTDFILPCSIQSLLSKINSYFHIQNFPCSQSESNPHSPQINPSQWLFTHCWSSKHGSPLIRSPEHMFSINGRNLQTYDIHELI